MHNGDHLSREIQVAILNTLRLYFQYSCSVFNVFFCMLTEMKGAYVVDVEK